VLSVLVLHTTIFSILPAFFISFSRFREPMGSRRCLLSVGPLVSWDNSVPFDTLVRHELQNQFRLRAFSHALRSRPSISR